MLRTFYPWYEGPPHIFCAKTPVHFNCVAYSCLKSEFLLEVRVDDRRANRCARQIVAHFGKSQEHLMRMSDNSMTLHLLTQ